MSDITEIAALRLANTALREKQAQLLIRQQLLEQTIAQLQHQTALQEQTITLLHQENSLLKQQLVRFTDHQPPSSAPNAPQPPAFVKPKRLTKPARAPRTQRKAREQAVRHLEQPTRYVDCAYDHCPTCNYQLSGGSLFSSHQVIDLPAPQPVEVVEYRYLKRYCPLCQQYRTPPRQLEGIAIGQARFGINVSALVSLLRVVGRLPIGFIITYLALVHQLQLSAGEICLMLERVSAAGAAQAAQIKAQLLAGSTLHMDETSWRLNGKSGYIWMMGNSEGLRYYHYSQSRGSAVAQMLLKNARGQPYQGVLNTDFYAAYHNVHAGERQGCWVHLLRDLNQLVADYGASHPEVEWWRGRLQGLYRAGKWLNEREVGPEVRERWAKRLMVKLQALAMCYAERAEHPAQTLSKRLLQYQEALFTYVRREGVSADNNLAERGIRPLAVARKISGGSRSEQAAKVRMRLQTLFGTWLAKGLNPLTECLRMLGATNSFQQA